MHNSVKNYTSMSKHFNKIAIEKFDTQRFQYQKDEI